MKLFKTALPFYVLGIIFLFLGIITSDPRLFSFGVVWFLIAAARYILGPAKEKVN